MPRYDFQVIAVTNQYNSGAAFAQWVVFDRMRGLDIELARCSTSFMAERIVAALNLVEATETQPSTHKTIGPMEDTSTYV